MISVLTASGRAAHRHLLDAYESLLTQDGVEWEWVIHLDGAHRTLPAGVRNDPRVRVEANGERLGIAITRNRALMRARGERIQNLDDDDMLTCDSLARLSAALDRHPACAFAFGDSRGADARGALQANLRAPHGVLAPGALFDLWMTDGWSERTFPPLAPSAIMWRRAILLAAGGWRAMSGCEDTALLMGVAEIYPSVGIGAATIVIREHPARTSLSPAFRAAKTGHWEFIREQVLALRALSQHAPGRALAD